MAVITQRNYGSQRYYDVEMKEKTFTFWFERQRGTPHWVWTQNSITGHAGDVHDCGSRDDCLLEIGAEAAELEQESRPTTLGELREQIVTESLANCSAMRDMIATPR